MRNGTQKLIGQKSLYQDTHSAATLCLDWQEPQPSWRLPGVKAVIALAPYCNPYMRQKTLGASAITAFAESHIGETPAGQACMPVVSDRAILTNRFFEFHSALYTKSSDAFSRSLKQIIELIANFRRTSDFANRLELVLNRSRETVKVMASVCFVVQLPNHRISTVNSTLSKFRLVEVMKVDETLGCGQTNWIEAPEQANHFDLYQRAML